MISFFFFLPAATRATATTRSESSTFMTLTPWVARESSEMSPAFTRITTPSSETIIISCFSLMIFIAAIMPFLSVILIVDMPPPPR